MNRLVDERTAAIELRRALPAGVVLRGTMPFHIGAREHEPAEAAGVERGLQLARAIAEAGLKNRRHLHAGFFRRLEQFVRARRGDLDRLLDDDVLARPDRRQRGLQVSAARRGDAYHMDVRTLHQFLHARRGKRHVPLLREGLPIVGIARGDSHQLAALRRGDGLRVKIGDHADADDTETQRGRGGSAHAEKQKGVTRQLDRRTTPMTSPESELFHGRLPHGREQSANIAERLR